MNASSAGANSFPQRFGEWVVNHRLLVIILTLILVPLAGSGGRHLLFTTDYRVFFSEDNPQLVAFETLERTYSKNDNVMFVIAPRDGVIFSKERLTMLAEFTEKCWQIPYSLRVDSIANFQHSFSEEDDLVVVPLVDLEMDELTPERVAEIREIALNDPLLPNKIISPAGDVTAVNVTIHLAGEDLVNELPDVMTFSRNLRDELQAQYPELDIYLGGTSVMNNSFTESAMGDMATLVPLSFLLMLLTLGLLLRGVTVTLATLFVILFSIMAAMGLGGYLGLPLSPPSASSPTIILTVAIANSVHILMTLLFEMRHHNRSKREAIIESLRVNLQPVTLASLTTAFGFLSLMTSEVPPFQHMGIFVAIGVIAGYMLSITFLPALLSYLPVRVKAAKDADHTQLSQLGRFVNRNRGRLLALSSALILGSVVFLPQNELNDVFVKYFDTSVPFRAASDFTEERLTGLYLIDYSLVTGKADGIFDPSFLAELEAFSNWLRTQPEVMHVASISDILKRLNKNMHGDNPNWYKVPEERPLAAQLILLFEMSLPYGLDLNNQINVDKSATRITATLETISSSRTIAFEDRCRVWLAENTTQIQRTDMSGTVLMFSHLSRRNVVSLLIGTSLALLMISLTLFFVFRSFTIGVFSVLSNMLPAAVGFGLWGLVVGEVGLALSTVVGMTMGIVVDDTVHFLSKFLRARREKGLDVEAAVVYSFTNVGGAMVVTSIVLVVGFLVLAFSTFKLNSAMGLLTAIVITAALAIDFFFLPPLITIFSRDKD